MAQQAEKPQRNGKLNVPLPFEDAVKAALETPPQEVPKKRPRGKTKRSRK